MDLMHNPYTLAFSTHYNSFFFFSPLASLFHWLICPFTTSCSLSLVAADVQICAGRSSHGRVSTGVWRWTYYCIGNMEPWCQDWFTSVKLVSKNCFGKWCMGLEALLMYFRIERESKKNTSGWVDGWVWVCASMWMRGWVDVCMYVFISIWLFAYICVLLYGWRINAFQSNNPFSLLQPSPSGPSSGIYYLCKINSFPLFFTSCELFFFFFFLPFPLPAFFKNHK